MVLVIDRRLQLHAYTSQDPLIKERVIQLAICFATGPLKRNAQFIFKLVEYILETHCPDDPAFEAYSEAVKDLHGFCLHQLQRLAMRFPDYLVVSEATFLDTVVSAKKWHVQTIFDELEKRIERLCQVADDEQTRVRLSSVLFIIT